MKKLKILTAAIALLTAAWVGYFLGTHHAPGQAEKDAADEKPDAKKPVAQVETTPVKRGKITRDITVYGSVTAQPDKVQTVSLPFESLVTRVLVSPGESVLKGAPVLEVEPSPETHLLYDEAKNSAEATAKDLRQTKQRFEAKLATNTELGAAEQAALTAENKLKNLEKRGIGEHKALLAEADGLIGEVKTQAGQIVQAGAPLLELIAGSQIEVKLGVEPGEVSHLSAGQTVRLFPVRDAAAPAVEGKIRLVTHRVNPDVRLADVFVSLPGDSPLLLNEYVRGQITVASADNALLVPRAALLPDEDAWSLFVAKDGHAAKKHVQKGLESESEVEISGSDLRDDEQVVVVGNYELQDGMAVETR